MAVPDRPEPRPVRRRVDVTALVTGVLASALGAALLWRAAGGALDWDLIKVAAPLVLVIVGVVGLVLSRNRP